MSSLADRRASRPWNRPVRGPGVVPAPAPAPVASVPRSQPAQPAQSTKKAPEVRASGPLIPEQYLEVGQQRLVAVSIFVAIQAYKLYELAMPGPRFTPESFALKYMLVDSAFLWCLPIFRIPWLTFTSAVAVVQIIAMAVFNSLLSTNSLSLSMFVLPIWRALFESEVSFSGTKIRHHSLDTKLHFSGKYTVNIMPESTALLNPTYDTFCVDTGPVYIPVLLNATNPIFVQLQRVDFEGDDYSFVNFTKKELKHLAIGNPPQIDAVIPDGPSHKHLRYLSLPVREPGLYRLKQVTDESNLEVRIQRSNTLVVSCPKAHIVGANRGADLCIGDTEAPKIVVEGVPPLKVSYSRSVKGSEARFTVQSVQPDDFTSAVTQGGFSIDGFSWNAPGQLEWAESRTVDVVMDTKLTFAGGWEYTIDEVQDVFGHKFNYTRLLETDNSPELLSSKSLYYGFNVHTRPQIHFDGCNSLSPVKMPKGQKAELPIKLAADSDGAPFDVTFERFPLEGDLDTPVAIFQHQFWKSGERLTVSAPGVYKIKSIAGKFCGGDVIESSSCLVYVPTEPTINVQFEAIEDKCARPKGVKADLMLTGTPPFAISYHIMKDGKVVETRTHRTSKSRDQIELLASKAGQYVYEFFSLDDAIYKGIRLQGQEFHKDQQVRVVAGASWDEKIGTRRLCPGDATKFKVLVSGVEPIKLTYEIIPDGQKRQEFVVPGIEGNEYWIETSPLHNGGKYAVSLVSIEDGQGCVSPIDQDDMVIEVNRQRPAAAFLPVDGSMKLTWLEGKAVRLPLRLSGSAPWQLTYQFEGESGDVEDRTISVNHANGDSIEAREQGRYTLTQVRDASCPGEITDAAAFELSWIPKPSMEVVATPAFSERLDNRYRRRDVCEGDEDAFELSFDGVPPFEVHYELQSSANGKKSSHKFQVATKHATMKLETIKAGEYTYKFKGVTDSNYDTQDLKFQESSAIYVEQRVNARPTARFSNVGRTYKSCLNSNFEALDGIPISFSGEAPFTLTIEVRQEGSGKKNKKTIKNIDETSYQLKNIQKDLPLGRHTVRIDKVVDAAGCSRENFKESEFVSIQVTDVPRITPINPKDGYCVGDRVGFSLDGVPPFEVVYEFNGKRQKASTRSPFSRLASFEGNLSFISLSDSGSSCVAPLNDMEPVLIHPIPAVSITEERSHQDIHEGDQAELMFTFTGTPPFSFTYTRSEYIGRPPKLSTVETHSVADVMDHQYSIFTSTQGTYEVIALEDAHCSVSSTE